MVVFLYTREAATSNFLLETGHPASDVLWRSSDPLQIWIWYIQIGYTLYSYVRINQNCIHRMRAAIIDTFPLRFFSDFKTKLDANALFGTSTHRKNRYDINARVTSATYYSQLSKRSHLQLVSWVAKTCTNMSRLVANTSHPVNNHYNSNPDTFWTNLVYLDTSYLLGAFSTFFILHLGMTVRTYVNIIADFRTSYCKLERANCEYGRFMPKHVD